MAFAFTACFESKTENTVEDAGEAVEETVEDAGDAMDDAAEEVEDEIEFWGIPNPVRDIRLVLESTP